MHQYGGRERRRTDLYGRARRALYGALLFFAAPGCMAADEFAQLGRFAAQVREGVQLNLEIQDVGPVKVKLNHSPEVRVSFNNGGGAMPVEAAVKYARTEGADDKVPQIVVKWRL